MANENQLQGCIIDWPVLMEICDDVDVVKIVAESVLENGPADVDALQEAISSGDADSIAKCAHKIRGSALTIAANRLAGVALELENAGRDGQADGHDEMFAQFKAQFDEMISFLSQPDWVEKAMAQ